MTSLRPITLAVLAIGLASNLVAQASRGPSTPEEREKAVRLARGLEADPLSASAKDDREWLTLWLIAVPDIKVSLCTEFYPALLGAKKNHASELVMQAPYSMAASMIEHPEKTEGDEAKYLAGVEGTLRAYESILRKEPKARWSALDELVVKRDKGELAEFVRATTPKCKSK